MPAVVEVTDPDDPRLADFRDLTNADRRPDRPGGRGLVIVEGVVAVRRLLGSPFPVRAVLGVPHRLAELAPQLDGPAYAATTAVLDAVLGFHLNRGVLAAAERAPVLDPAQLACGARTVAVLEGINDHENLGSLFRNAAALGVSAVVFGPRCADPLYRRSVRVSMGHVLRVPFATLPQRPPWPASLRLLRAAGLRVVALTPRPEAVPLRRAELRAGSRVAWLLGAEGSGLSDAAIAAADQLVRIPMAAGVDSLNVATAAAVAFESVQPELS